MSGIAIPGEQESSSLSPALQDDIYEERARKLNWKPLEEFKGDKADWVDAKDFLAREPLLKEVRDLKKHIKTQREQTERDMAIISAQFTQMSDLAYKKAVAELEARRDLAIQDQDIQQVRDLDKQIDQATLDHQKNVAQTRPEQRRAQQTNEEMDQWRQENTWFEQDQEMTDDAITIGVGYLAKNPKKAQSDMLKHVEEKIKKLYPEKFQTQQRTQVDQEDEANRVEGRSTSRPLGNRTKGKLNVSDLDDDEKHVMRTLIKRGVLRDIAAKNKRSEQDEFLAQLAEGRGK